MPNAKWRRDSERRRRRRAGLVPSSNASYDAAMGPARRLVKVDGRWVEETNQPAAEERRGESQTAPWE